MGGNGNFVNLRCKIIILATRDYKTIILESVG